MPVYNKYHGNAPAGAINVMRPHRLGNPFIIGRDGTREEVVAKFKRWLWEEVKAQRILPAELAALDGADLVCCCAPKSCHADVILEAARWAASNPS